MAFLVRSASIALCLAAPTATAAESGENGVEAALDRIRRVCVLTSRSGEFTVVGPDTVRTLAYLKWAERVKASVERVLGMPVPTGPWRSVRIDIALGSTSGVSRIATYQAVSGGRLAQTLSVVQGGNLDAEELHAALCGLFLGAFVAERRLAGGRSDPGRVPEWLTVGVTQNLDASLRARNSRYVLTAWQEGRIPSPSRFLRWAPGTGDEPDRRVCGVFVGWLLSLDGSADCLRCLFDSLAAEPSDPLEWTGRCLPACRSVEDLDERWDAWILRQKRIVYAPGVLALQQIEQIKSELLIYPQECGIALDGERKGPLRFADLIGQRAEPWMADFCGSKAIGLRLLAAGRGEELSRVVDLYAEFLRELPEHKSDERLIEILKRADQALADLESKVRIEHGGSEDNRGTD